MIFATKIIVAMMDTITFPETITFEREASIPVNSSKPAIATQEDIMSDCVIPLTAATSV